MSDSIKDRVEGNVDKLKGTSKQSIGNATDDTRMKQEGFMDQGKGEVKEGMADVKDQANETIRKVKTND